MSKRDEPNVLDRAMMFVATGLSAATGWWLCGYFDVVDPMIWGGALVISWMVFTTPWFLVLGFASIGVSYGLIMPIAYALDWWRRPGWKAVADRWSDDAT